MSTMDICTYLQKNEISQERFGKTLGVTQGAVWQWLKGETRITAERAIQIEKVTGGAITRHDLRPDVFGKRAA